GHNHYRNLPSGSSLRKGASPAVAWISAGASVAWYCIGLLKGSRRYGPDQDKINTIAKARVWVYTKCVFLGMKMDNKSFTEPKSEISERDLLGEEQTI